MRYIVLILLIFTNTIYSQTDYSNRWEDFFSYNNVKDIKINDSKLVALADNAIFIFDRDSEEIKKISSVNGLSGETTSALYYDPITGKIVIGYENGIVEIINEDGSVTTKPDIYNFNILGSKQINHISANETTLYFSTAFGIVAFDITNNEFKDTFFIGDASSEIYVNETIIFDNKIYAATRNGIYFASLDEPYLIDYSNWTHLFSENYSNIEVFNNNLYLSNDSVLLQLENDSSLIQINSQPQNIKDIRTIDDVEITISTQDYIRVYSQNLLLTEQITSSSNPDFYFSANTAMIYQDNLFIASKKYGILTSYRTTIYDLTEIHPEGPTSNDVFSISVSDNNLWIVYGGYVSYYAPLYQRRGVSHYNGEQWINFPTGDDSITEKDLVHVNIDPLHNNKVYISSWGSGMLIIEDDVITTHWNHTNSGLENLYTPPSTNVSIRIGSSVFDKEGNLWVANAWVTERLKKYDGANWSGYNLNTIMTNDAFGLNEIIIDNSGNKWIGSRRNGALVISKNTDKMLSLTSDTAKGNLPDPNVRALAVDKNNRVWIGTHAGLRVFNSSSSIFNNNVYQAEPVVIAYGEDEHVGEALLGNQSINTICVDGADNKWFGTETGGALYTNPTGKETLLHFDKSNSPLPSNLILKIRFDASNGKVYFATDKGIVAYNSKVAPFGEHLGDVYAYPNPVKKQHDHVTIDGRNGTHLPNGTNVKILDASGKLVYETNVEEGQELFGGKVVWDKTNLAGNKVASGVYIVLLTTEDSSETSMTKIAIIN